MATGSAGRCLVVLGAVAQSDQEMTELLALGGGEGGEEVVLGFALGAGGAVEVLLPGAGEGNDVAAAVCGVASAIDAPVLFEWVEQLDQHARRDAEHGSEFALCRWPVIVEEPEQVELARRQVLCVMGRSQASHRVLAQEREEQSGARRAFVKHSFRRRRRCAQRRGHVVKCRWQNRLVRYIKFMTAIKRAVTIDGPDAPPALRDDLPAPAPAENEILV